MSETTIPITFLDRKIPGINGSLITTNNKKAYYDLVSTLIQSGHNNIRFYALYDNITAPALQRFEGYCSALTDHGLTIQQDFLFRFNNDLRYSYPFLQNENHLTDNLNAAVQYYLQTILKK